MPMLLTGFLFLFTGFIAYYGISSDPDLVAITGIARCEALKETIDDDGIYWGDPDAARARLEEYKVKIESACPKEFSQLERELIGAFKNDCKTNRWSGTENIAKAMVECGVNEKDLFAIIGNAVQMRDGTFYLPTVSSANIETYSYQGVSGYGLKVVLRETEQHQYFSNRYSNKADVDADYRLLVSSMARVAPIELALKSNAE